MSLEIEFKRAPVLGSSKDFKSQGFICAVKGLANANKDIAAIKGYESNFMICVRLFIVGYIILISQGIGDMRMRHMPTS